jgi:hypothetical protein
MIEVGSNIQVFLVKKIFLDGLACRIPVLLRKVETRHNRDTQMLRLHGGKWYGNKQSSEDIATVIVSWSVLSLRVCA